MSAISTSADRQPGLLEVISRMRSFVEERQDAHSEREIERLLDQAHGLIIDLAKHISMESDQKRRLDLMRRLDDAMIRYQRRLTLLCMMRE